MATQDRSRENLGETISRVYSRRATLILSYFLLLSGFITFILQVAVSVYGSLFPLAPVGAGIWTGTVFMVMGSLGIWTSSKPSGKSLATLAIFSVFGILCSFALVIVESIEAAVLDQKVGNMSGFVYTLLIFGMLIIILAFSIGILACIPLCAEPIETSPSSFSIHGQRDISSNRGSEVNSAYGDPDDFGPIIGTSKSSPSQNNYAGDDYHFHKIYFPSTSTSTTPL